MTPWRPQGDPGSSEHQSLTFSLLLWLHVFCPRPGGLAQGEALCPPRLQGVRSPAPPAPCRAPLSDRLQCAPSSGACSRCTEAPVRKSVKVRAELGAPVVSWNPRACRGAARALGAKGLEPQALGLRDPSSGVAAGCTPTHPTPPHPSQAVSPFAGRTGRGDPKSPGPYTVTPSLPVPTRSPRLRAPPHPASPLVRGPRLRLPGPGSVRTPGGSIRAPPHPFPTLPG